MTLVEAAFSGPLAEQLACELPKATRLFWLGQAGFVLDIGGWRIAIDPYLSNTLAAKYAGTAYPHERMMNVPVDPNELGAVDLVLCTHHHTDHMDPGTLAPLAGRLPSLRFVVPAASVALARERAGVGDNRLIAVDAGESIEPFPGLVLRAVRAAHETLERDARGRHRFLGYGVSCAGLTIYHSGDCIPFDGQREEIAAITPDLALLPVNGRSPALLRAGIPGNFGVEEALGLCVGARIPAMIAHHYGMFAFNTVEPAQIDAVLAAAPLASTRARTQVVYALGLN